MGHKEKSALRKRPSRFLGYFWLAVLLMCAGMFAIGQASIAFGVLPLLGEAASSMGLILIGCVGLFAFAMDVRERGRAFRKGLVLSALVGALALAMGLQGCARVAMDAIGGARTEAVLVVEAHALGRRLSPKRGSASYSVRVLLLNGNGEARTLKAGAFLADTMRKGERLTVTY